jgi:hypothetical protein
MNELLKSIKDSGQQITEEQANLLKEYYMKMQQVGGDSTKPNPNQPDSEGGMTIIPNHYCCIKTTDTNCQKVFINITSHDKIEAPKEEHILEMDNQYGVRLPLSLSDKYEDFDTKGDICQVYDVIFNTNVVNKAEGDAYVFAMMVQLTFERIKQKYSHELAVNFVRMKNMKYKGKTTRPQRVRVRTGPKIEEIIRENDNESFNNANQNISQNVSNVVNEKGRTPNWNILILKSSNITNDLFKKLSSMSTNVINKRLIEEDLKINRYNEIVYFDGYNANPKTGEALLYLIELNLLSRSNGINLSVCDEGLVLTCGKIYSLELAFPFKINSEEICSFFDSTKRLLYLILPFYKIETNEGISQQGGETNNTNKGQFKISDDYLYDVVL